MLRGRGVWLCVQGESRISGDALGTRADTRLQDCGPGTFFASVDDRRQDEDAPRRTKAHQHCICSRLYAHTLGVSETVQPENETPSSEAFAVSAATVSASWPSRSAGALQRHFFSIVLRSSKSCALFVVALCDSGSERRVERSQQIKATVPRGLHFLRPLSTLVKKGWLPVIVDQL